MLKTGLTAALTAGALAGTPGLSVLAAVPASAAAIPRQDYRFHSLRACLSYGDYWETEGSTSTAIRSLAAYTATVTGGDPQPS